MLSRQAMQYEFENEFENEFEFEGEFENEFENEFEFEGEFENEYEYEGEFEGEFENEYEYEQEAFLGKLGALARKLAPILKKIAPIAANVAGAAIGGSQFEFESEFENEFESEFEYESEYETVPQITAIAKALAAMASRTQNEAEAEAYAGAMTAATLPMNSSSMRRVSPHLVKGSAALTRTLRKSSSTRHLVKVLPIILAEVRKSLERKVAQGETITPAIAARAMARAVNHVLGNPMKAAETLSPSKGRYPSTQPVPQRRRRTQPAF